MEICPTISSLRAFLASYRQAGRRVAFVPTMGALHEGHLTLVDEAQRRGDVVIASIFVNPLQFGPAEDLAKYPRTPESDAQALQERGVAAIFTPSAEEMYPPGRVTTVVAGPAAAMFEGAVRPGHFDGVLTVVAKLFNIVQPDIACFGQKDLQQLALLRQMVRDLDFPIEIVMVPTVREADGLAMSSRNRYLDPDERQRAAALSRSLEAIRAAFAAGERSATRLREVGAQVLAEATGITIDYLAIVDPQNFDVLDTAAPGTAVVLAARVGSTRLLDNLLL